MLWLFLIIIKKSRVVLATWENSIPLIQNFSDCGRDLERLYSYTFISKSLGKLKDLQNVDLWTVNATFQQRSRMILFLAHLLIQGISFNAVPLDSIVKLMKICKIHVPRHCCVQKQIHFFSDHESIILDRN